MPDYRTAFGLPPRPRPSGSSKLLGADGRPYSSSIQPSNYKDPAIEALYSEARKDMGDDGEHLLECKRRSRQWLEDNYVAEWVEVVQNYKCEEDSYLDPADASQIDTDQTAIGMPDTWGLVRRAVARVTAQPPSHRFTSDNMEIADRITRALMWQWDRTNPKRDHKLHVLQANLFGWSVKQWHWACDYTRRKRRVNPISVFEQGDGQRGELIIEQYRSPIEKALKQGFGEELNAAFPVLQNVQKVEDLFLLRQVDPIAWETLWVELSASLIAEHGKGGLLAVEEVWKYYEGPRSKTLFIGDCYPEPHFERLQSSCWFIVDRRRDLTWLKSLEKLHGGKNNKDLREGLNKLLRLFPDGSPRFSIHASNAENNHSFRERMLAAIGRSSQTDVYAEYGNGEYRGAEWTITEKHHVKPYPRIEYLAEDSIYLGSIEYPYDLEGKIAFTELVFVEDLFGGIGDSTARVVRGINKLHNRIANRRADLVDNLLKPLIGTSERSLYENPDQLKRHKQFRLFMALGGPNSLWVHNDGPALASAISSLQEESAYFRMLQTASGESNLSMAADVDPQQNRTATGAKIAALAADILTRDSTDMLTEGLRTDLEMMRLLNRSELSEPLPVGLNQTRRRFGDQPAPQIPVAPGQPEPQVLVTPEDFQYDGIVEVEVGSTLADDDDTKLTRAQVGYQLAVQNPAVFNVEAHADDLLIAMGKGSQLQKYRTQPQPPPPPEVRTTQSIAWKAEDLPPEVRAELAKRMLGSDPLQPQGEMPGGPPNAAQAGPSGPPPNGEMIGAAQPLRVPMLPPSEGTQGPQSTPNGLPLT